MMFIRHILSAVCAMVTMTAGATALASDDNGVLRYSATTANLDPEGTTLRFDVMRWSDDNAAAAVIGALQSEDVHAAIDEIPTVGYIWPEGSPVGYSIKYARRESVDSAERLTFVTSRPLGSYDFGGWSVQGESTVEALEYSVVELDLSDTGGTGMASLATPVALDVGTGAVKLDRGSTPTVLLENVRQLESPSY
jgi:hypothetical protein